MSIVKCSSRHIRIGSLHIDSFDSIGHGTRPKHYSFGYIHYGTVSQMRSPGLGGSSQSSGTSSGIWRSSAHRRTASKFLHVCLVLKSTKAPGNSSASGWNHTWPRTPTSIVHMSCWRMMSRQCAVASMSVPGSIKYWTRKRLTDMLLHHEFVVRKRTFPFGAIVVDVVVQRFSNEILRFLASLSDETICRDSPHNVVDGVPPRWQGSRLRTCYSPLLDLALIQSAGQHPRAHSEADLGHVSCFAIMSS